MTVYFFLFSWLRRPTSVNAYYVPAFNQISTSLILKKICYIYLPLEVAKVLMRNEQIHLFCSAILEGIMSAPIFNKDWPL